MPAEVTGRPGPGVRARMIEVMREVTYVGKDQLNKGEGGGGRFKFRGIDDLTRALGPALRRHGILTLPKVIKAERREAKTTRGKDTRETVLTVEFTLTDADGDSITITTEGESLDNGDKGTAKAMSVAWRTALIIAYSLPTDEPDPDSFTWDRGGDDSRERDERPRRGGRRARQDLDDDRRDDRDDDRYDDRDDRRDDRRERRDDRDDDRWRGRPTLRDHFGNDDERSEGGDRRREHTDPDRVNEQDGDEGDDLLDTADPDVARERAILALKDTMRHYKIRKEAAWDMFVTLFGEELTGAEAVLIDKFAELIIQIGGLPVIDKEPAEQHPMVLRLLKVRDAVDEVQAGSAAERDGA